MKQRASIWFRREFIKPWNEDPEVRVAALFIVVLWVLLGALVLGDVNGW